MLLKDYDMLIGEEIDLKLISKKEADLEKGYCPQYSFEIRLHNDTKSIGHINVRIGSNEKVMKYIGHIGYGINEEHRGNKYAKKACLLIKSIYKENNMDKVIITCNPDNIPSRKTCESLGAKLLEIVDVPKDLEIYSEEEKQKCRYELTI